MHVEPKKKARRARISVKLLFVHALKFSIPANPCCLSSSSFDHEFLQRRGQRRHAIALCDSGVVAVATLNGRCYCSSIDLAPSSSVVGAPRCCVRGNCRVFCWLGFELDGSRSRASSETIARRWGRWNNNILFGTRPNAFPVEDPAAVTVASIVAADSTAECNDYKTSCKAVTSS